VAGLLERPEVQAVTLEKPLSANFPVTIGVRRQGAFSWFHGASLFQALEQAASALEKRHA
jgi:hypothetical protein